MKVKEIHQEFIDEHVVECLQVILGGSYKEVPSGWHGHRVYRCSCCNKYFLTNYLGDNVREIRREVAMRLV